MNKNVQLVEDLVIMQIKGSEDVTEDLLKKYIDLYSSINPISDSEKEQVLVSLQTQLSIKMDRGHFIKDENHKSWYYNEKKNLSDKYWRRFSNYLLTDKGFSLNVVNSLDRTTDELIDLLGNPKLEFDFERKGLIIGDVQSGKTSTYTALINKASDAGYKIIILLTGTIEKLRQQTQARIDEGFIGLDSSAFNDQKSKVTIGVGVLDPSISAWAVTSTKSDFNKTMAKNLVGQLSGFNVPIIFVLKKNKSVLDKLGNWLEQFNANVKTKKIDSPLLLIDDEADNASINTNSPELDPTAINRGIRRLLNLFTKSNYVGFTATPFANIFIDPKSDDEMLKSDLFPKDFIFALEPPTNYIGARNIFGDEAEWSSMLHLNDDCEYKVPFKHKQNIEIEELPHSLYMAIENYFIANAILDLRDKKPKHRSMLINVSRFIKVQNQLGEIVDNFVRELQLDIRNYSKIVNGTLQSKLLEELKLNYNKYFKCEYNWIDIQNQLFESTSQIVVRIVNGNNASTSLDYDEHEDGLRIIAVGGISLSRGLTLEGLLISYFYRNSKMYDTLMQMGRWFGYRDGYKDLCQIWMPESAIDWYSHISIASDELRNEVRKMSALGKTPKDFGLCVRSDINSLLVTARNKMKTATEFTMAISISGKVIETPIIHKDIKIINNNFETTENLITDLEGQGYRSYDANLAINKPQYLSVPKKYIIKFLENFETHNYNIELKSQDILDFINKQENSFLDYWDVTIATGDGNDIKLGQVSIKQVVRKFAIKNSFNAIQMSGSKNRLGSTTEAKGGLTIEQVNTIHEIEDKKQKEEGKIKAYSENLYFESGIYRRPLLVIYPVELRTTKSGQSITEVEDIEKVNLKDQLGNKLIGISIGFPKNGDEENKKIIYKINQIKFEELYDVGSDEEIFDEDDFQ